MALSKISELGGQVILGNYLDEMIVPAIADGTAKAGWLVGISAAGVVGGTDTGAPDQITGFLLPQHTIDVDTAITSPLKVNVVIPKSGHLYACFVTDLNTSVPGSALKPSATAGSMAIEAVIENTHIARTYSYTDGDTVAVVTWA